MFSRRRKEQPAVSTNNKVNELIEAYNIYQKKLQEVIDTKVDYGFIKDLVDSSLQQNYIVVKLKCGDTLYIRNEENKEQVKLEDLD